MYGLNKIWDHDIVSINQSNATITVRKGKELRTVDLNICAENFRKEFSTQNGNCVGDRNIERKYFCLHTSGIKTMILFKRIYIFRKRMFYGNRAQRFHQLQKALTQLGFSTYDLT